MSAPICSISCWSTRTTSTRRRVVRRPWCSSLRTPRSIRKCGSYLPTSSTCGFLRTTIRTSWLARSCGRCGRRRAPSPSRSHERLDQERRHRNVNVARQRVNDVVLAEIHDRQQDGDAPEEQPDAQWAVSIPGVDRGEGGKRSVERWERCKPVRIEAVVDPRHEILAAPKLLHGAVDDLHNVVRLLPPRRCARPEEVGHERKEAHQQQRRYEMAIVAAVVQPEHKAHEDGQRKVHEVEKHRNEVLRADDGRLIERLLQGQRPQGARKERALQAREVVTRKPGLRRKATHGLVSEEQQEKRAPVGHECETAPKRDCDDQQREHHPLRLDRDAAPQHHAEDGREVKKAADQECAWLTHSPPRQPVLTTATAAISTVTESGNAFAPSAARVCLPASPSTSTISSEAPFKTFGWSPNPSAESTKPITWLTVKTLSSPAAASIWARSLSAH